MSTGMLIWYLFIIVVCGTTGVLILITLFKYAREKEGAAAPVPRERPDATPLSLLRGALNDTGEELYERTFHNHREAILETFGIEIKCDRILGYYIANSDDLEGDGIRQ